MQAGVVVEVEAAGAAEAYPVETAAARPVEASPVDTRSVLFCSDRRRSWACLHCT